MAFGVPGSSLAGAALAALLALGGCAGGDAPPVPQVAVPQDAAERGPALFFAICGDLDMAQAPARAAERGFRMPGDEALRDIRRGRAGEVRARSGRDAEGLFLASEPRLCEVTLSGPDTKRIAPGFAAGLAALRERGFTTTLLNESESVAGITRRWQAVGPGNVERIYAIAPYPDPERPWRALLWVTDDPEQLRAARRR
ncbi:hypothetical protein [Plastoroseomonas hellenica]|uniref:hypothetical protein n=1 Tax=Plastoroseomonas hellenica TaxID=2687306 RepID=UPI001BAA6B7A|nr:hypothetical protein [Plastoroseomonas hellenica]MBR0645823.1 hypothetical protein [Plastoroseomonas hellenica]